jgi:hypothetical protein
MIPTSKTIYCQLVTAVNDIGVKIEYRSDHAPPHAKAVYPSG